MSVGVGNRAEDNSDSPAFTIDRLSLTCDLEKEIFDPFRRWMYGKAEVRRGGPIYREWTQVPAGEDGAEVLVQWCPYRLGSVPFVRVEFNPAKAAKWADVLDSTVRPFLRCGWADAHITRIDPAVDYPFVNLRESFYTARNQKGAIHFSRDGIETIYLGAPSSSTRLRIYDKAKELEVSGAGKLGYPLTRIEAQKRAVNLTADQVSKLPNPFRNLRVSRSPPPVGLSYRYKLYIQEGERVGIDAVLKQLKRDERKTLKGILEGMGSEIIHPRDVYQAEFRPFCEKHFSHFWLEAWEKR